MAQAAVTLRKATFRKAGMTGVLTDVLLVAAGALLVAASAQFSIKLPFTPVPITGQTFSVLLVGAGLGSWRGGASMLLYVALGGLGAHFYAGGAHGWSVIFGAGALGASGGYLVSYPVAGWVTGKLAELGWDKKFRSSIGAMLTGNVIIYVIGLPWLAWKLHTGLGKTLELGLYPFIPGDTFKLYLAAAALPGAWWIIGRTRREP